jgi:hypothetical protein
MSRERNPADLLPLAPREFLVLLALAAGRSHGYGLIQETERLSDGRVAMDPANLSARATTRRSVTVRKRPSFRSKKSTLKDFLWLIRKDRVPHVTVATATASASA